MELKTCEAIVPKSRGAENESCTRCGEKFKSANDKILQGEQEGVCAACYRNIVFPEVIMRCPELVE